MRITFLVPTANLSGGAKVAGIYARQLARMGHAVRVVSPPVRRPSLRRNPKLLLKWEFWQSIFSRQKSYFDDGGVDLHVLDRWRPVTDDDVPDADVVIATWWETAEWANALSAGKGAKVYFVQGHEVFPHLPVERSKATYHFPMHKIVVSRWLKDVMRTEYGDDTADLVPNSVDRSQFFAPVRDKQAKPTVGFLYSRGAYKSIDIIDEALRIVRRQRPDLRLIAFGNGRPISQWPLPEGTEFSFSPPQDHLRNIYAACDVWVTASKSEGFNLPPLEAMACRTPVVSTRTGWPEEAIRTGWNGVLVDIDDVNAIASGVEWVLSRNDEEWRVLSANAHATAAVGSWDESAKLFEQALQHACRRSARSEIAGRCSAAVQAAMAQSS